MLNRDLSHLKRKVALARQFLMSEGLIGMFGHVSCYVPEEQVMLINPTTASVKDRIGPDDIIAMTLDGAPRGGHGTPPREYVIHTAIHRARSDALAVIHTHPTFSTSLSIAGQPIRPVYMHGAALGAGVPVYDDPEMITTEEQAQRMVRDLGSAAAVELRGHGSVTVGRSVEEAFAVAVFLEDNSRKQLLAGLAGTVHFLSESEIARLQRSTIHDSLFANFWDFYEKYRMQ